jgi:hypothetical protein
MEAMKTQILEVTVPAGATDIPMSVVAAGVERPAKLVGVTDGLQQIRRLVVFRGRYFDPDDMMSHAKVCLLTQELAERAFPREPLYPMYSLRLFSEEWRDPFLKVAFHLTSEGPSIANQSHHRV